MTSSSTAETVAGGAPAGTGLALRHLWGVAAVAALAVRAAATIQDNSFLWHVRAGAVQLASGEVLRTDPFSFTAFGESWRTQSWLLELAYGRLEALTGGLGWVRFMLFVFGALTVVLAGLAAYRVVSNATAAGIAMLSVTWMLWFFLVPRPVSASFVLLALVVVVLQHERRLGWTIVPLMWLWAAVHGTFVVGLGLVVLEALRRRSRRLAALAVVGGIATVATAHGLGIWAVTLRFFSNRDALEFLTEWGPPDFTNPMLLPFLAVVVGLLVAAVRGALELRDLVVVVPFLLFGLSQERTVFPALLVLLPYASGALRGLPVRQASGSRLLNGGLAVSMVVLGLVVLVSSPAKISETKFPSPDVVAAITDGEPVFHGVRTGGYLIYAEGPQRRVFIDDRAELYGAAGFQRFLDTVETRDWEDVFAEFAITQALVRTEWPIADDLEQAGWVPVASDATFALYRSP